MQYCNTITNTDTNTDANTDTNTDANTDTNTITNTITNAYANIHGDLVELYNTLPVIKGRTRLLYYSSIIREVKNLVLKKFVHPADKNMLGCGSG